MSEVKKDSDETLEETPEVSPEDIQEELSKEILKDSAELEALKEENEKLKESFLRAHAEMENVKRRCQSEIEKNNRYAVSSFAKELLAVADNLDRAIASIPENERKNNLLLKGIELTQSELFKVFARFYISKMESIGKIFDPNFHQVIQEVEDPKKKPGTIISEVQPGYMISDRILREAMVVVSKK